MSRYRAKKEYKDAQKEEVLAMAQAAQAGGSGSRKHAQPDESSGSSRPTKKSTPAASTAAPKWLFKKGVILGDIGMTAEALASKLTAAGTMKDGRFLISIQPQRSIKKNKGQATWLTTWKDSLLVQTFPLRSQEFLSSLVKTAIAQVEAEHDGEDVDLATLWDDADMRSAALASGVARQKGSTLVARLPDSTEQAPPPASPKRTFKLKAVRWPAQGYSQSWAFEVAVRLDSATGRLASASTPTSQVRLETVRVLETQELRVDTGPLSLLQLEPSLVVANTKSSRKRKDVTAKLSFFHLTLSVLHRGDSKEIEILEAALGRKLFTSPPGMFRAKLIVKPRQSIIYPISFDHPFQLGRFVTRQEANRAKDSLDDFLANACDRSDTLINIEDEFKAWKNEWCRTELREGRARSSLIQQVAEGDACGEHCSCVNGSLVERRHLCALAGSKARSPKCLGLSVPCNGMRKSRCIWCSAFVPLAHQISQLIRDPAFIENEKVAKSKQRDRVRLPPDGGLELTREELPKATDAEEASVWSLGALPMIPNSQPSSKMVNITLPSTLPNGDNSETIQVSASLQEDWELLVQYIEGSLRSVDYKAGCCIAVWPSATEAALSVDEELEDKWLPLRRLRAWTDSKSMLAQSLDLRVQHQFEMRDGKRVPVLPLHGFLDGALLQYVPNFINELKAGGLEATTWLRSGSAQLQGTSTTQLPLSSFLGAQDEMATLSIALQPEQSSSYRYSHSKLTSDVAWPTGEHECKPEVMMDTCFSFPPRTEALEPKHADLIKQLAERAAAVDLQHERFKLPFLKPGLTTTPFRAQWAKERLATIEELQELQAEVPESERDRVFGTRLASGFRTLHLGSSETRAVDYAARSIYQSFECDPEDSDDEEDEDDEDEDEEDEDDEDEEDEDEEDEDEDQEMDDAALEEESKPNVDLDEEKGKTIESLWEATLDEDELQELEYDSDDDDDDYEDEDDEQDADEGMDDVAAADAAAFATATVAFEDPSRNWPKTRDRKVASYFRYVTRSLIKHKTHGLREGGVGMLIRPPAMPRDDIGASMLGHVSHHEPLGHDKDYVNARIEAWFFNKIIRSFSFEGLCVAFSSQRTYNLDWMRELVYRFKDTAFPLKHLEEILKLSNEELGPLDPAKFLHWRHNCGNGMSVLKRHTKHLKNVERRAEARQATLKGKKKA